MHRILALPLACLVLIAALRAGEPATYAPMIDAVAPSVVTIYTSAAVPQQQRRMIMPFHEEDPNWQRFFGPLEPQRGQRQSGQGSGVIVSADGIILTNSHVVEGADQIEVQLRGGRERVKATLIGSDRKTDIAVLRISGKDLRPITFADSDKVRVGDLAFAIGNPFGVGQTVSMGIVSAVERSGVGIVDYEDFIQTDASINPGNSGGALVDSLGRLMGINTAIFSRTGGNIGIGFAVPANLAKRIMDQLVGGGKVVRGYLGVQIGEVTAELARKFGVEAGAGALVGGGGRGRTGGRRRRQTWRRHHAHRRHRGQRPASAAHARRRHQAGQRDRADRATRWQGRAVEADRGRAARRTGGGDRRRSGRGRRPHRRHAPGPLAADPPAG